MTLLGDLGPTIVAVLWVETSMACVFVIARVYSRKFVSHSVGYDDYLAVVTLVCRSLPIPVICQVPDSRSSFSSYIPSSVP